jgi:hypothetical protein
LSCIKVNDESLLDSHLVGRRKAVEPKSWKWRDEDPIGRLSGRLRPNLVIMYEDIKRSPLYIG